MWAFPTLALLILVISTQGTVDGENNSEASILLKIKQELGNPSAIDDWKSESSSACKWSGVLCQSGSVVGLNLTNMAINVSVPASICTLTNLYFLNLAYNDIGGGFPKVLYKCSKLQHLDISQNYFVDELPDDIDTLSSLQYLDAGANNFTGRIPSTVGNMENLRVLSLDSNLFNGTLPKEIARLTNLEKLSLAYNNEFDNHQIPPEYGSLNSLKFLYMSGTNLIGSLPSSFGNLSSLRHLDLARNKLEGEIPESLFSLRNLTHLYLFDNNLSGKMPANVQALTLTEVDVSGNNLTGAIPEAFGNLKQLQILHLYSNKLSGAVPESLARLPSLISFRVFSNNLSGILPPEMGTHSKLLSFEVSNNYFNGELPRNLCAGGQLQGIIAFSNNLTGDLPESLSSCGTLSTIYLSDNNMSGEIPPAVWGLPNLMFLTVKGNSFTGYLPGEVGPKLFQVDISDNRFIGSIAPWKNLVVFHASNNQLTGEIPAAFAESNTIEKIIIDGNNLTGEIPKNIVSWMSLTTLNLSRNNLQGEIPEKLGSLPVLEYLDLSQNHLSGRIPPQIGKLKPSSLNLSSNLLYGQIPYQYDTTAYSTSFLNNSGLCTATLQLDLPRCTNGTGQSKKLSSALIAVIVVVAVVSTAVAATSFFAVVLVRDWKNRKHKCDKNWKVTSFQRLPFTEEKVLENLSDVNLIGSGGSGRVYKVQIDQNSHEFVAVKKIWNKRKMDDKLDKEFAAEVQILGMLRHSNIVRLLCCISSDDSKILVYEYLENSSLDKWLHDRKRMSALWSNSDQRFTLNWPARLQIAIGAAQGLSYMHHDCSPAIIHRDIKSSNILLDSEFKVRIADFGLAKLLEGDEDLHTVSAVVGSLGYIAPEYGYTMRVTEKVDVYSYGVVLLELVTGREPGEVCDHMTLAGWAWKHFAEGKPIGDCIDEEILQQGNMEEITTVFKLGLLCTSKSPSSRPSMSDILQVLKKYSRNNIKEEKLVMDIEPLLRNSASHTIIYVS